MKYFIFYMILQLLISKVFGNCLSKSDIEEKFIPGHVNQYGQWITEETVQVIKSIETSCYEVVFPLENLITDYCENCSKTLTIFTLDGTATLPTDAFVNIPDYNILNLNDLHLSKIYPGAFGQHRFTEIHLNNNEIEEIELGIFNSLVSIQVLDLSHNNIKRILTHSLIGSTALKKLNISNNDLTDFSFDIFDPNIKLIDNIDLSFNNLTNFTINEKLQILNISLNNNQIKLTKFCPLSFNSLNLMNNLLNDLPIMYCNDGYINRLLKFDISFNQISTVPQFYFKNASHLEYLFLNHNNISTLSTGVFFNLDHLKQLNLSENRLQQFEHGTFDSIPSLEILDLSFNDLKSIKQSLHALTNLKELYIHNNKIASIDREFLYVSFLKKISFYNNNFSCDNLIQFIHSIQNAEYNTQIVYGTTRNSSNIHGIACSDTIQERNPSKNIENLKLNIENILTSLLKESNNKNKEEKDVLKDYFNSDFKNSNFYKFMANFQESSSIKFNETEIFKYFNNDFEKSKFYKYLESLKDTKNSTDFKKNMYDYFNNDFKNSGFVKYLEDLKNYKISLNEDFAKSNMYNYFNDDFEKSKFYQYLENLRKPDTPLFQNIPEFEKLVDSEKTEDKKVVVSVTINTIFIICMCFLQGILIYKKFFKKSSKPHEQVELLQA